MIPSRKSLALVCKLQGDHPLTPENVIVTARNTISKVIIMSTLPQFEKKNMCDYSKSK